MKLIPMIMMFASLSESAMEVKLNCGMSLDGDVNMAKNPIVLNSESKNSEYFSTFLGWDHNNSIIVSLNKSASLCSDSGCKEMSGTIYTLSLVRLENPVRKAQQLESDYREKVRGTTSATIEFTQRTDGSPMQADFMENGKLVYNSTRMPESISIDYSVTRGVLKERQQIGFKCEIQI